MSTYLVLQSLHIVAMVAWFAGLFYLPRLFVYHIDCPNTEAQRMLKTMERRLYRAIMWPAMLATWGFGIALLFQQPSLLTGSLWLPVKLILVIALTAFHLSLGVFRRRIARGLNRRSERFFRLYNEIPTVVLLLVVILAVAKPF